MSGLNGDRVRKPAQAVAPGDVLTFPQGRIVRVIRVEKLGERRGPAPEAQMLYFDMTEKQDVPPKNPEFEEKVVRLRKTVAHLIFLAQKIADLILKSRPD